MCFFFLVLEGVLDVGIVVWVYIFKIRYYYGFVLYKGIKLYVDLYDGDKFVYEMKDVSRRVIFDVSLKVVDIKFGIRVIVKFKKKLRYYRFIVMEIDVFDSSELKYYVKFDDGDEIWDLFY